MPDVLVLDLSHHNDVTDFAAIKAAGIYAVIHKATEGSDYIDPTFQARRDAARAAGLLFGAYHFLRPGDMEQQAAFFLSVAYDDDDVSTQFCADHEDSGVSLDDLKTFLAAVRDETRLIPALYSGNVIKEQLGSAADTELAQYPLWLAQYTEGLAPPTWPYATWPDWWLWQYTDQGSIAGVSNAVDFDSFDGSPEQLAASWAQLVPSVPLVAPIDIAMRVPPGIPVRISINGTIVVDDGLT